MVRTDSHELLNPLVMEAGNMACLSFNFVSFTGGKASRWNCSEVYRNGPQGWRIVQTHWSYTDVGAALQKCGAV
jgi:hypothetical protein